MPTNKWDEENIENLLKDFPAIKDERPKEEVYKRLQKVQKPQEKPKHWIPYLVAALAFITFGILLASMLGQSSNESAFDMSGSEGAEESTAESGESRSTAVENNSGGESESAEAESSEAADSAESEEAFTSMQGAGEPAAVSVYAENLDGQTLFTLGLTENAVVIPVSFLISNERLQEDFGETDVDAAELYNRYAAEIDEEGLGFEEYHPYSGNIETTVEGIEHTVPEGHVYDMASTSITVYLNSLAASFPAANEISITDEAGGTANFDQVGPVEPVDPSSGNKAYYSYATLMGDTYLVPAYDMPHENAVAALEAMKSSPNDLYVSVIPAGLDYSVSETEQTVTVEFAEAIDFDSYGYQEAMRLIEGMVLAADSFGKELVLANTAEEIWNDFDFTGYLPVPAGINVKDFNR